MSGSEADFGLLKHFNFQSSIQAKQMGILQSVLQYLREPYEDEKSISCATSYYYNGGETLKYFPPSHNAHHQTISLPNTKTINQNTPGNVKRRAAKQKAEEAVTTTIKCNVRWMKHYGSCHQILIVGDGDFSFSTCLASAFGWASNMVATSLDSHAFLVKNYHNAFSNLAQLSIRGCKVMHEIDATKMSNHPYLGVMKFDRIVFNFPFAGFFTNVSPDSQLRRHRRLVSQFMKNAKEMISENGEIHITHKTNGIHMEWKVESMAYSHRLKLVEAVDFNPLKYPGYNTKYGFGGDKIFNCYPSKTYKFSL